MGHTITECFCMWSDLLGFGEAFQEGNWTFAHPATLRNAERLRDLTTCFYTSADPLHEVALVLNDGLARVYDMPADRADPQLFLRWFHTILFNHWHVNTIDHEAGRPGLRSVLTFGERMITWRGPTTLHERLQYSGPRPKLDDRICIYSPDEFQLNLAFSKAYLIEGLGSRAGLVGPALFIDEEALDKIECTLTSQPKEIVAWSGFEAYVSPVTYEITRSVQGDVFVFEIVQSMPGRARTGSFTIEFEAAPFPVETRGIKTRVWKVRRYQPIDEEKPFFFDFTVYRWGRS